MPLIKSLLEAAVIVARTELNHPLPTATAPAAAEHAVQQQHASLLLDYFSFAAVTSTSTVTSESAIQSFAADYSSCERCCCCDDVLGASLVLLWLRSCCCCQAIALPSLPFLFVLHQFCLTVAEVILQLPKQLLHSQTLPS